MIQTSREVHHILLCLSHYPVRVGIGTEATIRYCHAIWAPGLFLRNEAVVRFPSCNSYVSRTVINEAGDI